MRARKKKESKNLGLAAYFAVLVFIIIAISLVFKGVEIAKNSKFDGKHRFTVAILGTNSADLISVEPEEGTETRLHIESLKSLNQIMDLSVPFDGYAVRSQDNASKTKSYFLKLLLNKRKIKTDLSVLDLIRLSLYSRGVSDEKIKEESSSGKDVNRLTSLSQTLFIDSLISQEKVSIQIINSTDISGLGNRLAKYITNIGGNVVLVNSSKEVEKKTRILYREKNYTVDKISKKLEIEATKQNSNSISDITVIIGQDRESSF